MNGRINERLQRRRWQSRQAAIRHLMAEVIAYEDSRGLIALLQGCLDICNKRLHDYEAQDYKRWNAEYNRTMQQLLGTDNTKEE